MKLEKWQRLSSELDETGMADEISNEATKGTWHQGWQTLSHNG